MFFAFLQCILHTYHWRLCAWVDGTIPRMISTHLTWYDATRRLYALFSHHWSNLLAFYIHCSGRVNPLKSKLEDIFVQHVGLPFVQKLDTQSNIHNCPLQDHNWDEVSISLEISCFKQKIFDFCRLTSLLPQKSFSLSVRSQIVWRQRLSWNCQDLWY